MRRLLLVVIAGIALLALSVPVASARGTATLPPGACAGITAHPDGLITATEAVNTNPGEGENAVTLVCAS